MLSQRNIPKTPGIYKICAPSGNFYIGSSANMRARIAAHKTMLEKGYHHNSALQNSFRKYGGNLEASVLLECSIDALISQEQAHIDSLKPKYNQSLIAGRIEQNDEARAKRSASLRGVPKTAEHRANLSKSRIGLKWTEAQHEKKRNAKRDYRHSDETKAKIGEGNKGKIVSAETRRRLSVSISEHYAKRRMEGIAA